MNLTGSISLRHNGKALTFKGDMEFQMSNKTKEPQVSATGEVLGSTTKFHSRYFKGKFAHRADVEVKELEAIEDQTIVAKDEETDVLYTLTEASVTEVGAVNSDGEFEMTIHFDDYEKN